MKTKNSNIHLLSVPNLVVLFRLLSLVVNIEIILKTARDVIRLVLHGVVIGRVVHSQQMSEHPDIAFASARVCSVVSMRNVRGSALR